MKQINNLKKVISSLVLASMCVGTNSVNNFTRPFEVYNGTFTPHKSYANQRSNEISPWAIGGIDFIKNKKILNDSFFSQYKKNITRKEFAYLAVRTYECILEKSLNDVDVNLNNIYSDTNDEYVRKAFYAGIMNGYGNNYFAAYDEITREQVMVLMVNLLDKAGINLSVQNAENINFKDESMIGEWANEKVKIAYYNKIVKGTGELTVSPREKLTKEQALIIVSNIIQKINDFKALNTSSLSEPILKWAYGGTYDTWCEDGWYSTPAIADFNNDGTFEIVGSSYSIVNLNAKTGKLNWKIGSGHDINQKDGKYEGRTWPDIIIKDIDQDGSQEIITAHNKGYISVYNSKGEFKKGWPQKPIDDEFRSLKVADLDLDGKMEIIAGASRSSGKNTWVFSCDGELRKGWPQLDEFYDGAERQKNGMAPSITETSFSWGIFTNSISVGDINNDKYLEIIVPSDVPFVCAYDKDGNLLDTNPKYGGRKWGQIGFWESIEMEDKLANEGWGFEVNDKSPSMERRTVNFANGASNIVDVDNDGVNEIVITGNVYDRFVGHPPNLYITPFILNGDRTRYNKNGNDWSESPKDTGKPLSEDYNLIEYCNPYPTVSDMDGDGLKEILYSSYDGKVHCFSLDKTEKNNWPYEVYIPENSNRNTYEFASAPVVMDINNDNKNEVIFSTWTEKEPDITGKSYNGKVVILDYKGNLISEAQLPFPLGSKYSNGGMATPLVKDIDNDNEYEIVLNTTYSGLVAYDLPGSKVK